MKSEKNKDRHAEPELWDTPHRLCGIATLRKTACDGEERPPGVTGNPSHLVLGSEELVHRQTERVLDFAGEVLNIRTEGPWRWQRPFLVGLLRRFFDEASNAPAWLTIIPFRLPHQHRFASSDMEVTEIPEPALPVAAYRTLRHSRLALGYAIGEVDTTELLLAYQRQSHDESPYVMRQGRSRILDGSACGESHDTLFYFAHPDADGSQIRQAHIPEMTRLYDPQLRLLKTASVTLAKMSGGPRGDVTQLIVTLQPQDGWTAALVSGQRSLQTYLLQYPTDRSLLMRGLAGDA